MKFRVAVCAREISSATTELLLLPEGEFTSIDGRPEEVDAWRLTPDRGRQIAAEAAKRNTPFILDYEHQTIHSESNGKPAPRAAKYRLEYRPGVGLMAVDIQWMPRAKQYIEDDEYGYISPVFPYDPDTGEVTGYFHGALTNVPGLDIDVQALAAAKFNTDQPQLEDAVMNEEILKLLGLEKGATEEQIKQAVVALKERQLAVETLKGLGLDPGAEGEKINATVAALQAQVTERDDKIAALKANAGDGNPDPEKYAPVEVVEDLKSQVADLSARITGGEVEELVTAGLQDGRLNKAQETWARELGKKDIAALKGYLENASPIAALVDTQTGGKPPADDGKDRDLSDDELAICRATGVSPESYKKANNIGTAASA